MPAHHKAHRPLILSVFLLALLGLALLQSLSLPRWSTGFLAAQSARTLILTGSTDLNRMTSPPPEEEGNNLPLTRMGPGYASVNLGHILTMLPFAGLGELAQSIFNHPQPDFIPLKFCSASNLLFSALVPALLLALLLALGFTPRVSLTTTALFSLATIFGAFALGSECSEALLAFALLASFYSLVRYSQNHRRGWLALSSVSALYLVSLKPYAPIFIIPLAVYLLLVSPPPWRRNWTDLALLLLPSLVMSGVVFAFNYHRFGSIWGMFSPLELWGSGNIASGIYGLLLSPGAGLFLYSPVLLLSLLGLRRFFHLHRREAIFALLNLTLLLVLFSPCWFWGGDFLWGSRYLLVAIAPLMVACAHLLKKVSRRAKYIALVAFLTIGLVVQIPSWFISLSAPSELIPSYPLLANYPECSPLALKWQALGVQLGKVFGKSAGVLEIYDWNRISRLGMEAFAGDQILRPFTLRVLVSPTAKIETRLAVSLVAVLLMIGIVFFALRIPGTIRKWGDSEKRGLEGR